MLTRSRTATLVAACVILCSCITNGFVVVVSSSSSSRHSSASVSLQMKEKNVDRKAFLAETAAAIWFTTSNPAFASGGATAGGAYLLSAKQRYNKRVVAGIKGFLALEEGSSESAVEYFATDAEGGWADASAAGYLLANAFRTSSPKPPDSLPSVKVNILLSSRGLNEFFSFFFEGGHLYN